MISRRFAALLLPPLLLTGCVQPPMYNWGRYESGLYQYYKSPASQADFAEKLKADIAAAEEREQVPPGLYAEYGFLLMKQGESGKANLYFAKEMMKWPESRTLMSSLIKGTPATSSGH